MAIIVNLKQNTSNLTVQLAQTVVSAVLVNASTDTDIITLTEGYEINDPALVNSLLSIRAETQPELVGSVRLELSGTISHARTENVAPYTLYGDNTGDYAGVVFTNGSYTITLTPWSEASLGGVSGTPLIINFTVNFPSENLINGDISIPALTADGIVINGPLFGIVGSRGNSVRNSAGTANDTVIAINPIEVGDIAIACFVSDNGTQTTSGNTSKHSVSDTKSHTWTKVFERTYTNGVENDGVTLSMFFTKVTSELVVATDIVTFTVDESVTDAIGSVIRVTVPAGKTVDFITGYTESSGAGADLTYSHTLSSLPLRQYFFVGLLGGEGADASKGVSSPFSVNYDSRSTSTSSESNLHIHVQHAIVATTSQTVDSLNVTGWETIQSLTAFYLVDEAISISGNLSIPAITSTASLTRTVPTYSVSGNLNIPNITSTGILSRTVPIYSVSGNLNIPQITSTGAITRTVPVYSINGSVNIPQITSTASLNVTTPVYNVSGNLNIPQITSTGAITRTIPVYSIDGNISIPQLTSSGVINNVVPVYSINGSVSIPQLTSTGALTYALIFLINGDINIPQIAVTGDVNNIVPVYNLNGNVSIPLITSDASINNTLPVYSITGELLIPGLTSNAALVVTIPVYSINGSLQIPNITSSATLTNVLPIYAVSGNLNIPNLLSSGSIENIKPIYSINGDVSLNAIQATGVISFRPKINYKVGGSFTGISLYVKKDGVFITSEINLM